MQMKNVENVLDDFDVLYKISNKTALVEFWTDTAGQDIPVEFDYDGTEKDFVKKFCDYAEAYDVDEEVELYAGMRGTRGVPDTIRELLNDCQEAKDSLMNMAEKLKNCIKGKPKVQAQCLFG